MVDIKSKTSLIRHTQKKYVIKIKKCSTHVAHLYIIVIYICDIFFIHTKYVIWEVFLLYIFVSYIWLSCITWHFPWSYFVLYAIFFYNMELSFTMYGQLLIVHGVSGTSFQFCCSLSHLLGHHMKFFFLLKYSCL